MSSKAIYPKRDFHERFGDLSKHPNFHNRLIITVIAHSKDRVAQLESKFGKGHTDKILERLPHKPVYKDHDGFMIGTVSKAWKEKDGSIQAEIIIPSMSASPKMAETIRELNDEFSKSEDKRQLRGISLGGSHLEYENGYEDFVVQECTFCREGYDEGTQVLRTESRLSKNQSKQSNETKTTKNTESIPSEYQNYIKRKMATEAPAQAPVQQQQAPAPTPVQGAPVPQQGPATIKWPEPDYPKREDFDTWIPEGFEEKPSSEAAKKMQDFMLNKGRDYAYQSSLLQHEIYKNNRSVLDEISEFVEPGAVDEIFRLGSDPKSASTFNTIKALNNRIKEMKQKLSSAEQAVQASSAQTSEFDKLLDRLPDFQSFTGSTIKQWLAQQRRSTAATPASSSQVPVSMRSGGATPAVQQQQPAVAPLVTDVRMSADQPSSHKLLWSAIYKEVNPENASKRIKTT